MVVAQLVNKSPAWETLRLLLYPTELYVLIGFRAGLTRGCISNSRITKYR